MLVLPEEFELISFFESEPSLATPDAPWCYNSVRFEVRRDKDTVVCELEPAYGEMKILWEQDGVPRINCKLNKLANMSVHIAKGDEHMVVTGLGKNPATILKLRLKPYVAVELGCWYEIP